MNSFKKSESSYSNKGLKGFALSVNSAFEGVVHTLIYERNMRLHFSAAFIVLIAGIYLNLPAIEFMLLCFAVSFVLVSELFNTAVEHAIDFISDETHPTAKIIKDIAAGAVFVSVVNACIAGYILLYKHITFKLDGWFVKIKQSPWHVTLITLIAVIGIVLAVKVIRREKVLLRGGMPSGHSAVAFAVWTVVTLISSNVLVSFLVFLLAFMIAKSRLTNGVHTICQIIVGSFLGILVALLFFQLLY